MIRKSKWWVGIVLVVASIVLWGCGASDGAGDVTPEAGTGSEGFPAKASRSRSMKRER